MNLEEVEIVESPVRERKVMSLPDSSKDNQDEEDENEKQMQKEKEKEREKQMQNEKEKERQKEKQREKEMEREKEEKEKEKEKENDEFSYSKFASLHFQGSSTHSHVQQRLRQPLLYHEDEGDALASAVLIRNMFPSKVLMINCVLFSPSSSRLAWQYGGSFWDLWEIFQSRSKNVFLLYLTPFRWTLVRDKRGDSVALLD